MSNTIYENNYNEFIEKHNIDLFRLKRDYIANPLKRGEKPHKEDLEYLYLELNLSVKEISEQYITNKIGATVQRYLKFYKIKKPQHLRVILYKQTMLDKYGVENPMYCDEFKEKIKQTNLERYGAENPFQSEEFKEKIKRVNIERYGVENASQSEEIKGKIKQVNIERYGVENPMQSDKIKNKVKQILINNYGVEHISQKNIPLETLEILNYKDKLIKFFEDNNTKSRKIIADKLDVSLSVIDTRVKQYGLSEEYNKWGCPSSYEEEILNKIREFYDGEILTNKKILDGKEIDIYLPEFNMGIEFNGNYWHSKVKLLEKSYNPQLYHYEKSMLARNKGIFLLHIFEYEYNSGKDKYIDYIRRLMGLVEEISIDDCIINRVAENEYVSFIGDNSLQGQDNSQIQLGLYYNDELVEVMSFTELGNDVYELVNHTVKQGKNVINGINKLFNHFINTYKPNKVTGYNTIHNQLSDIFKNINFNYSHTIDPTFTQIGGSIIYDCGREVWEWFK